MRPVFPAVAMMVLGITSVNAPARAAQDHPPPPPAQSLAAKTITAPSGQDRAVRAKQCDAEANRRGLHDSGLQDFRNSCLASAAPIRAVGDKQHAPAPTPEKPRLDALTDAPKP